MKTRMECSRLTKSTARTHTRRAKTPFASSDRGSARRRPWELYAGLLCGSNDWTQCLRLPSGTQGCVLVLSNDISDGRDRLVESGRSEVIAIWNGPSVSDELH